MDHLDQEDQILFFCTNISSDQSDYFYLFDWEGLYLNGIPFGFHNQVPFKYISEWLLKSKQIKYKRFRLLTRLMFLLLFFILSFVKKNILISLFFICTVCIFWVKLMRFSVFFLELREYFANSLSNFHFYWLFISIFRSNECTFIEIWLYFLQNIWKPLNKTGHLHPFHLFTAIFISKYQFLWELHDTNFKTI